ncbi:MAG: HAD family hydrolase, partial [Rickettsiales bacterium]|nr:HAD family hydrolase [Rickettsiales bacterium]
MRKIINILNKSFGADLLAIIALVGSILTAQYIAAALLIFMLVSGKALEKYASRKASSVLEDLARRVPSIAHLRNKNIITEIAITKIAIGDEIIIYPHETCPVDGSIIEGGGTMDESYLTGEPYQILKTVGSLVLSGAINGDSLIIIRAEKLAEDSRYAKIMEVMKEAEERRPHLMRLADEIGAIFAPIALIFAATTWYFSGDILRFIAVLTVATPCPLLIAIPITVIGAISLAAKNGIIIKDPTVLERLPTCSTAIFDKTGTLTYGEPKLTGIIVAQGFAADDILQKTASLERYSRHPLAIAIKNSLEEKKLELLEATEVSERSGQGLRGIVSG